MTNYINFKFHKLTYETPFLKSLVSSDKKILQIGEKRVMP